MKGTLISILVGALAGVLLSIVPALRASHAGTPRHAAPVDAVSSPLPADVARATSPGARGDDARSGAESVAPK